MPRKNAALSSAQRLARPLRASHLEEEVRTLILNERRVVFVFFSRRAAGGSRMLGGMLVGKMWKTLAILFSLLQSASSFQLKQWLDDHFPTFG